MYIEYMRKSISKIYPGEKWKHKVSSMSDYQVMAIYDSFYKSGKFEEYDRLESARKKLRNKARIDRTKLLTKCDSRDNEKNNDLDQLTFDDILKGDSKND